MNVKKDDLAKRIGVLAILRYVLAIALMALMAVYVYRQLPAARPVDEAALFLGDGSREDPYRIESEEDLALLAETVNGGETFAGAYFRQTRDLDLAGHGNWTPIGVYDGSYAFSGVYDGDGHVIKNLVIHAEELSHGNVGLFGKLAGTVCDLGIESGEIIGAYIGSIASHAAADSTPMIINCYNKASLTGKRCGGIADNFGDGKIICCWNTGELNGNTVGAITSCTAATVYGCAGLQPLVSSQFQGNVFCSEVCTEIDPQAIEQSVKRARYEQDLQYVYG